MGPTNYECNCECHTNEEYIHEGHCCFVCPKCHDRILAHLYNEHKHSCSKAKRLAKRIKKERKQPVNPTNQPDIKKKNCRRHQYYG